MFPASTEPCGGRKLLLIMAGLALPGWAAISGATTYSSGTTSLSEKAFTSSTSDASGVYVYGTSTTTTLTLTNSTVSTSGASTSTDSSSFYGLNSGVLAGNYGKIVLSGTKVTTSGSGANGVFAYGSGVIDISDDSVICTNNYAHAIMCSGGGTMTARNLYLKTSGTNSGVVATDRGSGTITIDSSTIIAGGGDSPDYYSTGVLTANYCTATSAQEGIVIEGTNSVILNHGSLTSAGARKSRGIMIMQSMSGDAQGKSSTVKLDHVAYNWTNTAGPAFFITNDTAAVTLNAATVTSSSPLLILASSVAYSTAETWGKSGSNGGHAVFAVDSGTALVGNVVVDSISSVGITFKNGSSLIGNVDSANKAKLATIALDATSTWTVTSASYVDTLADPGISTANSLVSNIVGKGHNVYYTACKVGSTTVTSGVFSLAGTGGGCLLPVGSTATCSTSGIEAPSGHRLGQTTFRAVFGRVDLGAAWADRTKTVEIFDLHGNRLGSKTTTAERLDLRSDFGIVGDKTCIARIVSAQ